MASKGTITWITLLTAALAALGAALGGRCTPLPPPDPAEVERYDPHNGD